MTTDAGRTGRVAVVTGASGGIGRAIVERLVADHTVVASVRSTDEAAAATEMWASLGSPPDVVVADLTDRDRCRSLIDDCVERHGRIDALVNNAAVTGPSARQPLLDCTDDAFDELFDVNVAAAFRCSQAAARHMASGRGGVVVNIGSVASFVAQHGATPYSMSKAALLGLTRGIALELGESGVRSVLVAPGDIDIGTDPGTADPRAARFQRTTPLGRRGTPDDVAAVVQFICSPEAEFVSGTSWAVDGGWLSY